MLNEPRGRLAYLDGMRGVAILLVLLFHAFARWPDLVPYGDQYQSVPLFRVGFIGVNLFFIISGFVILMTLEKCASFKIFFARRWLRLFPAMLICSAIIFATAPLFPERPLGQPMWRDLLPGMTFIDPAIWQKLIGGSQGALEGAFWSLYVEMKFYVVFGLIYFVLGRAIAVWGLIILFVLSIATHLLTGSSSLLVVLGKGLGLLGAEYYGWFAAGALFFLYVRDKRLVWLVSGLGLGFASAAEMGGIETQIAAVLVTVLFAAALVSDSVQSVLSWKWLLIVGFASYPLYLLHENVMIATIIKLGVAAPSLPMFLYPILPIAALMILAWIVAAHLEPRLKRGLRQAFRPRETMTA